MAHSVEVGDIFVRQTMCDDTLISFYQVTKTTERTVTIRKIRARAVTPQECKSDTCVAIADDFMPNEEPLRKLVQPEGHLRFAYGNAYPWDGTPQYRSWGR